MIKSRDEYSESLENQYRRMERLYKKILNNFESETKSKNEENLFRKN